MLWGVSITKLANAVITLRRANLEEKYDMLFDAWDYGKAGKVKFKDIEKGLTRLKASSDELHVEFVSEAAVKALPSSANPNNHVFDRETFKRFAELLVLEMGQPFNVVSELLLLGALEVQPREEQELTLLREIKGKVDEEARTAEQHRSLAEDPTVTSLFQAFNTSHSGRLSFSEVAHMLHKLRQDISLRQARAEAVNLMLLLDTESERSLGRMEFARFLQKMSTLMCMDPQVLASILLEIAGQEISRTLDDAATALMMETQNPISQVYETLGDRRLHLLYELWDKDGDGTISFAEVCLGLRKFCHESEPANETAADAAEALLIFDANSDQRLDWADFARFINHFCDACGADFGVLSEYLILLAALDDNPTEELAFLLSEDKVERAIVEVDNMWRKDPGSDRQSSEEQTSLSSKSSKEASGGKQSLQSLTSNVRDGIQGMSLASKDQGDGSEGVKKGGLQRVTSDIHHRMQASPFESRDGHLDKEESKSDKFDGHQSPFDSPKQQKPPSLHKSLSKIQTDTKAPQEQNSGGLPSLKSRMSFRHS